MKYKQETLIQHGILIVISLGLPLGISKFQGMYYTEWNLLMAGTLIVMAPLLIIYLSAQRYFVEGITTTGLK